jgi:protein-tyrosine phosphatase
MVQGITPIIAHPERNEAIAKEPELLFELVEAGALAQMTAASISRQTSPAILAMSAFLLTHNLVHLIASDAHSSHRRPPILSKYARRISCVLGAERAEALTHGIPNAILRGESVSVPSPVMFSKQSRREAEYVAKQLAAAGAQAQASGSKRRGLARMFSLFTALGRE